MMAGAISVVQLGRVAYGEGHRLQQKLVELRKEGKIGDVLLLLEHTRVITLGRNAKAANVLVSTEQLAARGVEVFECDRGGDVTFHGPGQIVGYPIFDLRGYSRQPSAVSHQPSAVSGQPSAISPQEEHAEAAAESLPSSLPSWRKTLGAVDYVRRLEEVLIRTCSEFGILTRRVAGLTGVWTEEATASHTSQTGIRETGRDPSTPEGDRFASRAPSLRMTPFEEAKIAAIGVHISRGVTSHGFALNVNTDLDFFNLIVPCGIVAKPVTSIQKVLGHEAEMDAVAQSLVRNFGLAFGRETRWVDTIDALCGNTVGVPMRPPKELRKIHQDEDTAWA